MGVSRARGEKRACGRLERPLAGQCLAGEADAGKSTSLLGLDVGSGQSGSSGRDETSGTRRVATPRRRANVRSHCDPESRSICPLMQHALLEVYDCLQDSVGPACGRFVRLDDSLKCEPMCDQRLQVH